jgi:stage V sporulation protein G
VTSVHLADPDAREDRRIVAWVSICLNDAIQIRNAKLIRHNDGSIRLAWPCRRTRSGAFKDTVHPVSRDVQDVIEREVFDAYGRHRRDLHRKPGQFIRYSPAPLRHLTNEEVDEIAWQGAVAETFHVPEEHLFAFDDFYAVDPDGHTFTEVDHD